MTPRSGYLVDANLLVLLVAGAADPTIIRKHRRLTEFSHDDYQLLLTVLFSRPSRLFVTPNTLTEASNLLRQHGEPERSLLMAGLRYLIEDSEEIVVVSEQASSNPQFQRLGLTDAAVLEAISEQAPLITVDLDLYLAAIERGENLAVHFRQII